MRRRFALACLLLLAGAARAAGLPPVEDFFRLPRYAAMQISPDGKHIAALSPVKGRQNLVMLDVPPQGGARRHRARGRRTCSGSTGSTASGSCFGTGSLATRDFDFRGGELYAVDLDGGRAARPGRPEGRTR